MPSPVFDREQYELRGHLPTVYTEEQKQALSQVLARVNGQIDWNAQLLGFNGPSYWGKRIPTIDGSYEWEGLPRTVSEKRAVQVGSYGVYNKDRDYSERPAPFNRSKVGASADLAFDVFAQDGKTHVVPFGQPRDVLYESTPRLIVGGEYVFNELVDVTAAGGPDETFYVTQDISQRLTSVRILNSDSTGVNISVEGSLAEPFLFFIEDWEDINDWGSEQIRNQFLGLWGNKGNWISSHFLFDALDVHGFNEEEGLSLDDILKEISIAELLELIGLKPGPATAYLTSHYNFSVEGCDDVYNPTVSLETKTTVLQTQDLKDLETDNGELLAIEDPACNVETEPPIKLLINAPQGSASITDNGTFEDPIPPLETVSNGEYPLTSVPTSSLDDDGFFTDEPTELATENGFEICIDDASIYTKPCYLPPDPEFGICDTPNFTMTLRQFYDPEPDEIATDPGPDTSFAIGCNGVLFLGPIDGDINNGEYEQPLGQFYLDDGDFDDAIPPTNVVDEGIYDRSPFDGNVTQEDFERIIDYDDLIIDVDGQPGPVLMSDPGQFNEIVLVASDSDGEYDGFALAFDGLELSAVSFEYNAKTTFGEVEFPCVEWVFDPTLDNETYFPIPAEAAWMTADDGEFDRRPELDAVLYAEQSDVGCLNAKFISGFLSFDDGEFDELIQPFCNFAPTTLCENADGGIYTVGNPLPPPLVNTVCGEECGTIDNGPYVYGQLPFLGPPGIDGLGSADIDDDCVLYDGEEYDRVVSPEIACIGYDDGFIGVASEITCTLNDEEFGDDSAETVVDQGEYTDTYLPTVCTPCGKPLPPPQCYLDNGVIDFTVPTSDADEGFYDKGELLCQPCDPENPPPEPCPPLPIRVRLDQIIFQSPAWRMRPTVMNSKTPLRLWKHRVLNVADVGYDAAYTNTLIADKNTGPEDPAQYRHFARLPLEYPRNARFWNRTEAVLANQSYFSRLLPPSETQTTPSSLRPRLYDEDYYLDGTALPDYTTFYVEDYLVSQVRDTDLDNQSGFQQAIISFENPANSKPFNPSTIVDYDAYAYRRLLPDGSRAGRYLQYSSRRRFLTGFLQTDVDEGILTYAIGPEAELGDSSEFIAPNVEFPDDVDRASFSNYAVCYAYFVADLSASDDPVFDPKALYSFRTECLFGKEDATPAITTENDLEITTEAGEILIDEEDVIDDICVETETAYLLHERKEFLPRPPRPLGTRSRSSAFVAIKPLSLSLLVGDSGDVEITILNGVVEPFFFRWQVRLTPTSPWVDINDNATFDGATTYKLTITPQDNFYNQAQFRVAVESDLGFTYVTSEPCLLTVIPKEITITSQPGDSTVVSTNLAQFSVAATTNDNGVVSYQWQQWNGTNWINLTNGGQFSGVTTPVLGVTPAGLALDGSLYRAAVNSTGGAPTVFSSSAQLTVLPGTITITGPSDLYLFTREEGYFSVNATTDDGGTLSYEWQLDTGSGFVTITGQSYDNGLIGASVSGDDIATESLLILETEDGFELVEDIAAPATQTLDDGDMDGAPYPTTVTDDPWDGLVSFYPEGPNLRVVALSTAALNYKVRCIVTSSNTAPPATSTGPGRLVIYGIGIYITQQPQNLGPIGLRELASFFIQAYSDDSGTLTYQWQMNTNSGGGWTTISDGPLIDNDEFGFTFVPEEVLTESLLELIDDFGRLISTNDTGNTPEPTLDSGTYDGPLPTATVADQGYDVIIATYPDTSFLVVRPFSTLANGYLFRCLISSNGTPASQATSNQASITVQ